MPIDSLFLPVFKSSYPSLFVAVYEFLRMVGHKLASLHGHLHVMVWLLEGVKAAGLIYVWKYEGRSRDEESDKRC